MGMEPKNTKKNYFKQFQTFVLNRIASPSDTEKDSLLYWRSRILFAILFSGLLIGLLVVIPMIPFVIKERLWDLAIVDGSAFLITFGLIFCRMRYAIRTAITLLVAYIIGLGVILSVGPLSGGPAWLFTFAVLTGVLLGARSALIALAINAITLTIIGWLMNTGRFGQGFPFFHSSDAMIVAGVNFMLLNIVTAISVAVLVKGLIEVHQKEREASSSLEMERTHLMVAKERLESEVEERKQAEAAIRANERFLQDVFDGIQDGLSVLDMDLRIVKVNAWMETAYAQKMPLVGKKCYEVYQEREFPCPWCPSLRTIETNEVHSEIVPYPSETDPRGWIHLSSFPLRGAEGSVTGVIEHMKDITAQKHAEVALRRSEQDLRIRNRIAEIFLSAPDDEMYGEVLQVILKAMESQHGIFGYIDEEGNWVCPSLTRDIWDQCRLPEKEIVFTREQWAGIWGRAMLEKRTLYSNKPFALPEGHIGISGALDVPIIHQHELIGNILVGNKTTDYDEKDRQLLENISDYIAPVLNARLQRDREVNKRANLEAQLRQAHKMEAIGTLAGGVAHDFNNLLMAIQGRISLMLMTREVSHPDLEHLRGIEEYVSKATDLTRQLLGFARGGKYEVKPTDLNELIKKQNRMFGRTKKEISVRGTYEKDLWTVEVDRGQVDQVLLNLYVNAWQAMPGGGDLYVETKNVILDEDYVKPFAVAPGRYVKISVTDTGIGMDKATRERIFDPFFTTKEMGRGTGLGLASVYGIIKNHGGFINVYSEKGHGATFNIYLPASEKAVIDEKIPEGEIRKGSETILFIDDEEMIIEIAEELLAQLGYTVLTARSGKEAIEIYGQQRKQIDIVVLDMVMPDMSGAMTFDRLKEISSEVKVLLSSGYSIDGQATEILDRGCNGFIQKPFNLQKLSQKLREILDDQDAPPLKR